MPVAHIHIIEGRDDAKKQALIEKVSLAISESLEAPIEAVRVVIHEVPSTQFGIGGKTAKSMGR